MPLQGHSILNTEPSLMRGYSRVDQGVSKERMESGQQESQVRKPWELDQVGLRSVVCAAVRGGETNLEWERSRPYLRLERSDAAGRQGWHHRQT